MSGRILTSDPIAKKASLWYTEGDGVVVSNEQDVEPILQENADWLKIRKPGFRGDMHHVASIPIVVYQDLERRGIADDPVAFKKWLNDPDNKAFRTHPGRV